MTDLIEAKKSGLKSLCERYQVERLALFGSALRDDFDATRSDLDFSVEFKPMSPREHAEAYFGLLDGLESLFSRRVDLVEVGAVRNPYLRQDIEEYQEILYGAA